MKRQRSVIDPSEILRVICPHPIGQSDDVLIAIIDFQSIVVLVEESVHVFRVHNQRMASASEYFVASIQRFVIYGSDAVSVVFDPTLAA